jgi:tight adherence protein C
MALALTILIFLAVALVIFSLLGARSRALGLERRGPVEKLDLKDRLQHVLDPLSKAISLPLTDVSRTRQGLIQAGYRDAHHLTIYMGSRLACAFLFLIGAVFTAWDSPILLVSLTAFGFLLPRFALKRKIQNRQHRIRIGLPDALGLTVIGVEAGLALDQAMMRVGEDLHYAHPELSDELYLVSRGISRAMHAGYSWDEALSDLWHRTEVCEIKMLVHALVEAGPLGVVRVLRTYSNDLRLACQGQAEEQAAKTTIKMVILLVLFVLPSIIFVTLGPAFIQLIRTFKPVTDH